MFSAFHKMGIRVESILNFWQPMLSGTWGFGYIWHCYNLSFCTAFGNASASSVRRLRQPC